MTNDPIFVGGAGRSGTTLLRIILDSHPNIACGPELKVTPTLADLWQRFQTSHYKVLQEFYLSHQDINGLFRQFILGMIEKYQQKAGKQRVAEKSPNNVFVFQQLHGIFPESPLIHVIRDGRDVVCSLLGMDWVDIATGKPLAYTRDPQKAAEYWVGAVRAGRKLAQHVGDRYIEIPYETLTEDPETVLKDLFQRINEPWDECVLQFHRQTHDLANESSASQVVKPLSQHSVGRWEKDMLPEHKAIIKKVAGPLLIELGYASNNDW